MKHGSLFAGIGGLDLGFEKAGMDTVWQVEIDPFCQRVLEKHWPNVRRYKDVKECGRHNLEWVDVISGGFPCQPVSAAGYRQAQSDPRWLWPEFFRIICEIRPSWVVAENVPGLLSVNAGRAFGEVLRDLAEGGYNAEWDCIPAAALGALHVRERVWIVAYPTGTRLEGGSIFPTTRVRRYQFSLGCEPDGTAPWDVEPDVGRVANGISDRVDRIRGLGNAVVPQVAEWIGKRLVEAQE